MDKKKCGSDVVKRLLENIIYYGISLIFIIIPIILSFQLQNNLLFVTTWICIGIYIFSVFCFMKVPEKFMLVLWFLLILAIVYFSFVINFGTVMFFIFPASLLAYHLERELNSVYGEIMICAMIVCIIRGVIIYQSEWYSIVPLSLFLVFIVISMDMNGKRIRMKEEINKKNEELAHLAGEIERNRISRDLHDSLGHVFSTLSVKAELANKLVEINPELAKKELAEIHELSKVSLFKVRDIINDIQNINLEQELSNLRNILNKLEITLEMHVKCDFSPEVEYQIVMIIKELVNNIIKHSEARNVILELTGEADLFNLKIFDDGIGMHPDTHLKSISYRTKQLNGRMVIDKLEKGTVITIRN